MASLADQILDHVKSRLDSGKMEAKVTRPATTEAIRLTKRNTREGRGFADYDFGTYAPSTMKRKSSSTVTFRETGATINSLFGESTKNRGEITFGHNPIIMDYHQDGAGRNPKREIFPEEPEPKGATIEAFTKFIENKLEVYLDES